MQIISIQAIILLLSIVIVLLITYTILTLTANDNTLYKAGRLIVWIIGVILVPLLVSLLWLWIEGVDYVGVI